MALNQSFKSQKLSNTPNNPLKSKTPIFTNSKPNAALNQNSKNPNLISNPKSKLINSVQKSHKQNRGIESQTATPNRVWEIPSKNSRGSKFRSKTGRVPAEIEWIGVTQQAFKLENVIKASFYRLNLKNEDRSCVCSVCICVIVEDEVSGKTI